MNSDDVYHAQRYCPKCKKEQRTQVELMLRTIRLTCRVCNSVRELNRIPTVVREPFKDLGPEEWRSNGGRFLWSSMHDRHRHSPFSIHPKFGVAPFGIEAGQRA